eukprot:jgi/Chlat1/4676/Chrsp3S05639
MCSRELRVEREECFNVEVSIGTQVWQRPCVNRTFAFVISSMAVLDELVGAVMVTVNSTVGRNCLCTAAVTKLFPVTAGAVTYIAINVSQLYQQDEQLVVSNNVRSQDVPVTTVRECCLEERPPQLYWQEQCVNWDVIRSQGVPDINTGLHADREERPAKGGMVIMLPLFVPLLLHLIGKCLYPQRQSCRQELHARTRVEDARPVAHVHHQAEGVILPACSSSASAAKHHLNGTVHSSAAPSMLRIGATLVSDRQQAWKAAEEKIDQFMADPGVDAAVFCYNVATSRQGH